MELNKNTISFEYAILKVRNYYRENNIDEYGEKFDKEAIINRICDNSILKGITISGGEPLCKENIPEVLDFIKEVNKENQKYRFELQNIQSKRK